MNSSKGSSGHQSPQRTESGCCDSSLISILIFSLELILNKIIISYFLRGNNRYIDLVPKDTLMKEEP